MRIILQLLLMSAQDAQMAADWKYVPLTIYRRQVVDGTGRQGFGRHCAHGGQRIVLAGRAGAVRIPGGIKILRAGGVIVMPA